jgi:guanosine-3',5'-bis(diphosphate) 3'-pyrophosphohydrolase
MIKRRIDKVTEARLLAIKKHGAQLYSDGNPYILHLEEVVNVLIAFGYTEDKYIIGGYLHDILENTEISYKDIKELFGVEIAEIVYCVTDELGRDRDEKKEKTLPKTRTNKDAIIVKLGDRIANLENSVSKNIDINDNDFLIKYTKEHAVFKEMLYFVEHKAMWDHIDDLLK